MRETRVAWVIGGGSGIGAAVSRQLAAKGWRVAISGRRREQLEAVADDLSIFTYVLDVGDAEATGAVAQAIARDLGQLDLVLYGAAAWEPMEPGDYDPKKFGKVIDTNLMGAVRVVDAVLPVYDKQGKGEIAIIASIAGYFGLPRAAAYGASKAALIHLAQVLHSELASRRIAVRLVNPGFVKSPLTDKNDFPMPFLMETDDAATRIVKGLTESDRFEIAFPWQLVTALRLLRLLPYGLSLRLARRLIDKG